MGILTYSKASRIICTCVFLGFHQTCFFAFGFCQFLSFSKKKLFLEMILNPQKYISITHGILSIKKNSQKDPNKLNATKVFEHPTTYRIICNFACFCFSTKYLPESWIELIFHINHSKIYPLKKQETIDAFAFHMFFFRYKIMSL